MNAPATVPAIAEPKPALVAGARPRPIVPTDIDQVWRIASMTVKAGLAPRDLETPEKASIAIMHGLEIGLPPMMALQRIAVINGRPAVWGDAVPAIALATGLVEDWFETVQGEGDHMVATCRVKRKGIKSQTERTFSVADAKRAGLWDTREKVTRRKKDGTTYEAWNDSPWHRYPKRMLQMRARVAFRDLFSDALGGLYIAEELDVSDAAPAAMKDVTPRPVVQPGKGKDLPADLPTSEIVEDRDDEVIDDAEVEVSTNPAPATKRPLPPLAKSKKADEDIPPFLQRNCPPADEPEAFREWIVAKLGTARTIEDVQIVWDSHVLPNIESEQILPPDLEDISTVFAKRRGALEGK